MALPRHLFVGDDGHLCDTRKPNWWHFPVRLKYRRTYRVIRSVAELKATLRNGEYAWPGGYPMFLLANDGGCLHFECVRKEFRNCVDSIKRHINDGWRIVGNDINYENNDMVCDHCGERIESAYGDQEKESEQ